MINFELSNAAVIASDSFFITVAAIMLARPVAFKIGLTDRPCSRKKHQGEIPLIGGVAIFFCIAYIILTHNLANPVNIAFLAAVAIIVVTGVIDDFKGLSVKPRIVAEISATLIMINWGGVEITSLGDLFGFGEIQLGYFSTLFTVFAVVGGINAFNMIDGIDGLAGGISFTIYFLLSLLCIIYESSECLQLCSILAPTTAAFLLCNFPIKGRAKALTFLGDAGSMLFGFTICWLVISVSQGDHKIISPATVLWLIAAPILDSFGIILRRIRKGRSPFAPDREHFHHILQVAGFGKYSILFILLGFTAILAVIGLTADLLFNTPESLIFYVFIRVFSIYYWGMSHAWMLVKVARYLREDTIDRRKPNSDRRRANISPLPFADRRISERRSGKDRRHQATRKELSLFQKVIPAVKYLNKMLKLKMLP